MTTQHPMTRPPLDLEAIRRRLTGVKAYANSEVHPHAVDAAIYMTDDLLAEVERLAAENAGLRATRDEHLTRRREAEDRTDHLLYERATLSAQLEAAEEKVRLLEEAAERGRS